MDKQASKFKSPFKSGKYKSILTFLSPRVSKRHAAQNDATPSHSSLSIEEDNLYKKQFNPSTSLLSSDSIYSTIESLGDQSVQLSQLKNAKSEFLNSRDRSRSTPDRLNVAEFKSQKMLDSKEPLYASVNKKKQNQNNPHLEILEIQELKEDNGILKERLRDLSEDNRLLRKQLKEDKLKEENLHSNFQLKITELEAETRRDVKSLSDRIQILINEKKYLNDQIDILQLEKKAILIKNDNLSKQIQTMVSLDHHKSLIMEHERQIKELRLKQEEEINKLKEMNKGLEGSKSSLENQIKELENKIVTTETKLITLEKINHDLLEEKSSYLIQAEESRQMEQDMQSLLLTLLKMTESIAMERNVLMNKTSFQDNQQKEIQSTVIDYSLNIGRLQEHILNLNKDNQKELLKLKTSKYHFDENVQQHYGKQFDTLRGKILAQHNIINELENDKRKLESQLDLIWQAACGTNSKLLDDVKKIVNSQR